LHLDKLQKDPEKFINLLKSVFLINVKDTFIPIDKHTKTNQTGLINRDWNYIVIPENIEKLRPTVEERIEKLKNEYNYKCIYL
jgi:hypothetical protein